MTKNMIDGCVKRHSIYTQNILTVTVWFTFRDPGRFALGKFTRGSQNTTTQRDQNNAKPLDQGIPFRRSAILFRCSGDCCNKDMGMITAS